MFYPHFSLNLQKIMILILKNWCRLNGTSFSKSKALFWYSFLRQTYINSDPTGRTADNTLIIVVRQGCEPPSFTGHFVPWDADRWNVRFDLIFFSMRNFILIDTRNPEENDRRFSDFQMHFRQTKILCSASIFTKILFLNQKMKISRHWFR